MLRVNSDGDPGKDPFRLAVVANERNNSGHAQHERETFQALQTVGAECLDEYGGFLGRQSRCQCVCKSTPRTADVTVTNISGYVRVLILMNR